MQEEAFVKSQLVAFCKALSKVEAPLKQKHVRALVVGTHKLRSSRIFWHAVSRVQLEKNPVLTWKFCQLLHKLIHDGHRRVTEESANHSSRLAQLGNFWQHLRSSGYGQANTCYCKMLVSRLNFHKKYPSIPGNLNLSQRQLEALTADMNENYELAIDMLDQMDELLNLKATIMQIMDSLRWSSLVPQGQCLLAPLILVILDTSKLYDFLVKELFKLHANLPADTLVGHRERFYDIFRRTKKFYEEAANLQYFKYLVQIPTLPSVAPNFQRAHELDEYRAPEAYLHAQAVSESGDQSPPDAQSVNDEQISTIIDLSIPHMDNVSLMGDLASGIKQEDQMVAAASSPSTSQQASHTLFDPKDEIIARLRQDIDVERDTKERLIQEASIRIEQYEARLVQMKQEIDLHKQAAEERTEELQELRLLGSASTAQQQQSTEEIERKAQESEQKFGKLKGVYQQLREDHIKALTEMRDLRSRCDQNENDSRTRSEQLESLKAEMAQMRQEREFLECQAKLVEESVQTNAATIHASQQKITKLETEMEETKVEHEQKLQAMKAENEATAKKFAEYACASSLAMLDQSLEDLQNATSISYPTHLAAAELRVLIEHLDTIQCQLSLPTEGKSLPHFELHKSTGMFTHRLANSLVNCAAAAYTASIPHYEGVNEQCRAIYTQCVQFCKELQEPTVDESKCTQHLKFELEKLEELVKGLPSDGAGDFDAETVGRQLDEEMRRMGEAIAAAVEHIGELQRKSREANSGLKLEVNEKILEACNGLMGAVRDLVICSKGVQEEIVAQGRGVTSSVEFYKRNHLWTEGLISAGRAVGVAATVLVKSADSLIMGKGGKFEHLIVAAGSVGASVAQLFVSSRVKAEKGSQKLAELAGASRAVNKCTANLVGAVKSGQQSLAEEQLLDFSNLSLHDTKKEEMESQVRTLELEAELTKERSRLASLRKQHFHLAQLVSNEQQQVMEGQNGGGNE